MIRHARLSLHRSPRRLRPTPPSKTNGPTNAPAYPPPPPAGITHHGGVDEAPVADLPHDDTTMPGRPPTLGPGLPEYLAVQSTNQSTLRPEHETIRRSTMCLAAYVLVSTFRQVKLQTIEQQFWRGYASTPRRKDGTYPRRTSSETTLTAA
jgi:hypothetical protein